MQPLVAIVRAVVPERIEREIHIEAPLEVVWSVITEPRHVAGWFSDLAEIDLRPGGELTLTWPADGVARGRVVSVEPPTYFSFRWMRWAGGEFSEHNSTLVEFSLVAADGGTRLRVVESGFPDIDGDDDHKARYAGENREGWPLELDELRVYAEGLVRS